MPALLPRLLLLLVALTPVGAAQDTSVLLDKDAALVKLFPEADQVLERKHVLSRKQLKAIEKRLGHRLDEGGFFLYRATRRGQLLGHAVVVSQIGKVKPITHIVEVEPDGEVGSVEVMIYRESHGMEVAAARFMKQYRGKSLEDSIRVDRDIINIAGATLSAHAICRGVRKALVVVAELCAKEGEALWKQGVTDVTPDALQADGDRVGLLDDGAALRIERPVMGTVCRIDAYLADSGLDADGLAEALDAALDEVERWDGVLSDWRDDTALSRFNAAPVGQPVELDADLAAWLGDARRWHAATDGAFDPTVGALVDAWRLRTPNPARPAPEPLAAARQARGFEHLALADGQATRGVDGLRLDPGASGKGWALDRAAAILTERGVTRALLSFRSTLLALGPPPGQPAWTLPVVHDGRDAVLTVVRLERGALSVSGGGLRGFDDGGVYRGHVIAPRDGLPVPADRLAWVRHLSASASDALATALLVDGPTLIAPEDAHGGWLDTRSGEVRSWPALP